LLAEFLTEDQIKVPLQSGQKEAAIRELIELVSAKVTDGELTYQAVLQREKKMTTGVGNGVAIPHCKSETCSHFVVALGISPKGIDFNSVDGKKVNLVFLLLGPEDAPNMHIKLLSRISRIMNREEIRNRLIQVPSAALAYQLLKEAEKEFSGS
jgi:fructose-specific phosphotransferase system IIA component